MSEVVLSVDAGTSVIKTVAFDEAGEQVTVARQGTEVSRPMPGHSEQDMEEVWRAVSGTLREAAGQAGGEVRLIAFTGQGDGCWLVDRQGRPTGPAILWNDGRAGAIVEGWRRAGVLAEAFRINGSIGFSGLPHALFTWLAEREPDRLKRSHKALTCDGWLFYRFTGEMALDQSDASVPFFDIRARRYSDELLDLFDLEWAARLLPAVRDDHERVGRLRPEAAEELGLPENLPVVMAPYDIAATAIGVGAVVPGRSCSILGTTLCTEVVTDEVLTDQEPSGLTVALGVPDLYLRAFPTLAGTEVISWWVSTLGLSGPDSITELAAEAPQGAAGLIMLPYLSPSGERAPFLDPMARGSLEGLSLEHEPAHLARAILEGLSLVIRECLEASRARPQRLGLSGGGAHSELWCQLIADVTGIPTIRTADEEVGAKGAFLTGLVATGAEPSFAEAAQAHVVERDVFEPQPAHGDFYDHLYDRFLELRGTISDTWPALSNIGTDREAQPSQETDHA